MEFFTDGARRAWEVHVTCDTVFRVRAGARLDLLAPLKPAREGEPPLWQQLDVDDERFIDVLFLACERQAIAAGVDDAAFGKLLKGDRMAEAREAFFASWVAFFPKRDEEQDADPPAGDDDEPLDPDRLIWQTAGIVGVHAGPFTWRELLWMAQGKRFEAWERNAALQARMKHLATGDAVNSSDFNPLLRKPKAAAAGAGAPVKFSLAMIFEAKLEAARQQQQKQQQTP